MNKREQVAFDDAVKAAAINRALRWSDVAAIEPDLPAPTSGEFTEGWVYNSYNVRVTPAWSESVAHGDGKHPDVRDRSRTASQNGRALYSTKTLAFRAMRCEPEARYAATLASIDHQIAMELLGEAK